MGVFGSLFGENFSEQAAPVDWKKLTDLKEFDAMLQESYINSVVVFKHSTRCSISRMALRQFESDWKLYGNQMPYFLDLLAYRSISNAIAERLCVTHQSPQVLVIKDGQAIYHTSHEGISVAALLKFY